MATRVGCHCGGDKVEAPGAALEVTELDRRAARIRVIPRTLSLQTRTARMTAMAQTDRGCPESSQRRIFSTSATTSGPPELGRAAGHPRSLYTVVDQHAITVDYDPAEPVAASLVSFAQLLCLRRRPCPICVVRPELRSGACSAGLVLSCITGYGEASRMTQFKAQVRS